MSCCESESAKYMLIVNSTQSIAQFMHFRVKVFGVYSAGHDATHVSISRNAVLSHDWHGLGAPVHVVQGKIHCMHVLGPKSKFVSG